VRSQQRSDATTSRMIETLPNWTTAERLQDRRVGSARKAPRRSPTGTPPAHAARRKRSRVEENGGCAAISPCRSSAARVIPRSIWPDEPPPSPLARGVRRASPATPGALAPPAGRDFIGGGSCRKRREAGDDAADVLRQVPGRPAMRNSALRRAVLLLSGAVLGCSQRASSSLLRRDPRRRREGERVLLGEMCRLSTCPTALR
jgi:hypothetical protein